MTERINTSGVEELAIFQTVHGVCHINIVTGYSYVAI